MGVSALGGAAGNAGAKLAGAGINKAGNAAAQAFEKIAGNAGSLLEMRTIKLIGNK